MARLKGLIDFEGTLGGITAYMRNGERILRQASGADKKKIRRGKNYERTRENMMEFSGGVVAAKVLRQSITLVACTFTDTYFTGRLQGKYRDMISEGPGKRGQRTFNPLAHADAIRNVPFDVKLHLDSILRVKVSYYGKQRTHCGYLIHCGLYSRYGYFCTGRCHAFRTDLCHCYTAFVCIPCTNKKIQAYR